MKIAQLFGVKTNPSQPPRCCHKRNDGTECKAHPRKGRQYCFLHDPASQKKSAAARRAGGVIRGYKAQEVLKLPPNLPALPLRDTSDVVEMFRETVNQSFKPQFTESMRAGDVSPTDIRYSLRSERLG